MTARRIRITGAAIASMIAAGSFALSTAPAHASGGDAQVEQRGACSRAGTWKLKAKHDDGRIEVQFEVDTNRPGQTFTVKITDNGSTVFSGARRTARPSGSFEVEKSIANRSGRDKLVAHAVRGSNACTGSVSL